MLLLRSGLGVAHCLATLCVLVSNSTPEIPFYVMMESPVRYSLMSSCRRCSSAIKQQLPLSISFLPLSTTQPACPLFQHYLIELVKANPSELAFYKYILPAVNMLLYTIFYVSFHAHIIGPGRLQTARALVLRDSEYLLGDS